MARARGVSAIGRSPGDLRRRLAQRLALFVDPAQQLGQSPRHPADLGGAEFEPGLGQTGGNPVEHVGFGDTEFVSLGARGLTQHLREILAQLMALEQGLARQIRTLPSCGGVGADKGLGNSALIELIHRARIIEEQEPLVLSAARKQCAARAALVRAAPQPGEGGGFAAAWRLACAVH